MRFSSFAIAIALLSTSSHAADPKAQKPAPCTIRSPKKSFHDLNSIVRRPFEEGKKHDKDARNTSYIVKGYDYNVNFTINICSPVVEDVKNVQGVEKDMWQNVSAYYTHCGKTFSIGQASSELVFRGSKLVLNYTNGSPCGSTSSKRRRELIEDPDDDDKKKKGGKHGKDDEEDDDDDDDEDDNKGDDKDGKHDDKKNKGEKSPLRRKSTIISLLCDPTLETADTSFGFVGASEDDCTYFFESRSAAACGGTSAEQQAVGPTGVFGIIALIAVVVYVFGGIAYQRTVMHQRGWRQLPNYNMWASIAGFVKDIFIILTSSCARLLPSRRGYNQLPTHNGRGRGNSRAEDENRLIDQLDEEWDD